MCLVGVGDDGGSGCINNLHNVNSSDFSRGELVDKPILALFISVT